MKFMQKVQLIVSKMINLHKRYFFMLILKNITQEDLTVEQVQENIINT